MKPHVKLYLNYFDYDTSDFIPCELCGARACDIHHINARGMGGDPLGYKDVIENLQALCRKCHHLYGDKKQHLPRLQARHKEILSKQKQTP
jgi:5-methylcytosine-specific restriction endonuclease McrA